MMEEIRDPTGDTGKGAGGTVPETWMDRTTGTAQDLVADKVVILVGEIKITAEAEESKGGMVKTLTPPHQDRHRMWDGGQNCRDGGRSAVIKS